MSYPGKKETRITDPSFLDEAYIDHLIAEGLNVIVQFSKRCFDHPLLIEINELCKKYGPEFEVRFYGFYSDSFDCQDLRRIQNVKNLSVDCLCRADNTDAFSSLEELDKLSLGIFDMQDLSILDLPNFRSLKHLTIGETSKGSYDLSSLIYFDDLETLSIQAHTKNIDAIGHLKNLKNLGLSSIKRKSLEFVNSIKSLRSLFIILGGRENINEVAGDEIEELEIIRVRGLCELSYLERFRKLKKLRVEDQIRLESIRFSSTVSDLETVWFANCKNLSSIIGLEHLMSLRELHLAVTNLDFSSFIEQEMPNSLRRIHFFTGKQRQNEKIHAEILNRGYSVY